MSASASENVLSLLARMDFDRGLLAHQPEIEIDYFDYLLSQPGEPGPCADHAVQHDDVGHGDRGAMTTIGTKGPLVGLKRPLRAEVSAGEGVYLFSEHGMTVLKGSHVEALVALWDGTREMPTVLDSVGVAPEQAAGTIARLAGAGLVTLRWPGEHPCDERTAVCWEAGSVVPAAAGTAVANTPLRLVTEGEVDRATAATAA